VIHRRRDRDATVVYLPYPVYYEPQPIVVAQPPTEVVTRLTDRQREEIADEIERIVEDRIKAYRDSLNAEPPASTEPPPPPAPTGSRTLYLIPGCYMGNVSPEAMKLPKGCDLSKLTVVTP
jgi:hypothetical protein